MQGTPHEVENVPPDKDKKGSNQDGEESAGSPEAPTGPSGESAREPGAERDPTRKDRLRILRSRHLAFGLGRRDD